MAERRARRELKTTVADADRRMRRQARDTAAEATAEPGSRSRDNKLDLKDGEFDFRSYYPQEQARRKTSRTTCAAAAAAAAAVVAAAADDDDNDDDWRNMKLESSGLNGLPGVQHSHTKRAVKQGAVNINEQHGLSATEVKTAPG